MKRKREQIRPGIYRIILTDTRGKTYSPEKEFEAFRTVTVNGKTKKEWKCYAKFADAKAFHGSSEDRTEVTLRQVWEHFRIHGTRKMERATFRKLETQLPHLEPLMDTHVADHTPRTVNEWLTDVTKPEYLAESSGKRLSYHNELRLLAQLYNYYRRNFDRAFLNPIDRDHKEKAVVKERSSQAEKDMTTREFGRFLAALDTDLLRVLAETQYTLYARIQEAAGIHYEDFDPKTGLVTLRRRLVWPKEGEHLAFVAKGLKATKEKVIRSTQVARLLQEWCMRQGIRSGLVFQQEGRPLRYSYIRYHYNKAFRAAGLALSATHVIRHASLTEHYATGGDIFKTMHAAGHTKVETTQIYAKHRAEEVEATQLLLEEKLRAVKVTG